jgi:hypothetical protein
MLRTESVLRHRREEYSLECIREMILMMRMEWG